MTTHELPVARYGFEEPYNDGGLGLRAEVACSCGDVCGLAMLDGELVCNACRLADEREIPRPMPWPPHLVGRP